MKILILISLFSLSSFSATILSLEAGQSFFSSSKTKEYNSFPSGLEKYASFGIMRLDIEYGVYFSSSDMSADIKHDGESAQIKMSTSTFGAYINSFFGRFVAGIGIGKVTIKQEVDSELSSAQNKLIEKIYDLNDESNQKEIILSLGYSIWSTDYSSIYLKGEFTKYDRSEKTSIRLGFKHRFN